ncbi:fibronectin type III domain-containing protein [Candidatus Acetothermia bacterium]|nr:fibronectin type III domain-containing protein [Candidatus Acetothermia bacterium]
MKHTQTQPTNNQTKGVIAMLSMVQNVVTEIGSKKQLGVLIGVVLFVVLTLTVVDAKAQIRQFASDAKASSEYSPSDRNAAPGNAWSAFEMIGAPNVYSKCGDIRGAWAALTPDRGTETVELSFPTPVYATQLNVYETNVPGSITRVEFISADGTNVVGRDFSVSTPSCPDIFTVNASTPFLTNRVKLTLNTSRSGYEEIDAVELVGTASSNGGGNNGGGNGGNGGQAQLVASPSVVAPSQTVTVQFAGAPGNSRDWIGLYAAGADNKTFISYNYINSQRSGTTTFTAPTTPGQYEFRLFCCDGYTDSARSNTITVSTTGGGNNGGGNNGGGGPGGGNGGQVNQPPLAPTLLSPANNCNWNLAALDPSSVTLQWANNGDPDGDAVTFEVDLQQYNGTTRQWVTVLQKVVTGTALTVTNLQPGASYDWVVFAMDLNKRSNPWFTRSGISCFATASDGEIDIYIDSAEGALTAKAAGLAVANTQPGVKKVSALAQIVQLKKGALSTRNVQITVKIYTVAGKLVRTIGSETANALALTGLANGTYLVVIEKKNEDGRIHRTIKPVVVLH